MPASVNNQVKPLLAKGFLEVPLEGKLSVEGGAASEVGFDIEIQIPAPGLVVGPGAENPDLRARAEMTLGELLDSAFFAGGKAHEIGSRYQKSRATANSAMASRARRSSVSGSAARASLARTAF